MTHDGRELLVWWGDALLDAQHGKRVRSVWCEHDAVAIVLRPTRLEHAPRRPVAFLALVPAALVAVASLGAGAWVQHTDARELHARAIQPRDEAPRHTTALPSWVPPELCVPPPSPSDQDDVHAPVTHDERAEHVAYSPEGERGASEGSSPMRQQARAPELRTVAQVLESVDWQRPVSAFQNALESRAGDEWWSAGGVPGTERIRIRGTGHGGGGRGLGTIALGRVALGVSDTGRRGCTSMCCYQWCRRRGHRPTIIMGTTTVIGALGEDEVRRIERRHLGELRHCYEEALRTDTQLSGSITMQYFISPYGNVRSAIVAHSDLSHEGIEECFTHAVQRWMFHQPSNGGMVSVSQPFRLSVRR